MIGLAPAIALLARVPWQAWAVVAAIGIGGMIHWSAVRSAYQRGYGAAVTDVRAANVKAGIAADGGERAVTACFESGREWNRETGKCALP